MQCWPTDLVTRCRGGGGGGATSIMKTGFISREMPKSESDGQGFGPGLPAEGRGAGGLPARKSGIRPWPSRRRALFESKGPHAVGGDGGESGATVAQGRSTRPGICSEFGGGRRPRAPPGVALFASFGAPWPRSEAGVDQGYNLAGPGDLIFRAAPAARERAGRTEGTPSIESSGKRFLPLGAVRYGRGVDARRARTEAERVSIGRAGRVGHRMAWPNRQAGPNP